MSVGLLCLLNDGGCHAQAFVDDFAAVTGSSDLNAVVNLMQCILNKVNRRDSRELKDQLKDHVVLQGRASVKARISLRSSRAHEI